MSQLEESQPPEEPESQNNQERKEAKEADFDVRRVNSDPNSFFKVYFQEENSPPEASNPTCFEGRFIIVCIFIGLIGLIQRSRPFPYKYNELFPKPLSVMVERIMMLNIAALILVLIFTLTSCIRLYFLITREKCDERSIVLIRLIEFSKYFLCVLYAVVIRRKLCT